MEKRSTLAIETSCDDTSLSITSLDDAGAFSVDQLTSYSQIAHHQEFGGVVPEIAYRLHEEQILSLLGSFDRNQIQACDCISVTDSPGLPGSLMVGKAVAMFLASYYKKPIVRVNHIYGHLFSFLLERSLSDFPLPWVILTASGGHNNLYLVSSKQSHPRHFDEFQIKLLGSTRDDAAGESFDKVSRMLGGPYPGGVRLSQQAKKSEKYKDIVFKRIWVEKDGFEFSFSGMKSQVHNLLERFQKTGQQLDQELISHICFEFQEAVCDVLSTKLLDAAAYYGANVAGICGGVSNNTRLFEIIQQRNKNSQLDIVKPAKSVYCTDNAAMIGGVGLLQYLSMRS